MPKAEALLELAGAAAVSLDDAADDPVLEPPPGRAPLWPTVVVRALFPIDCDLAPLSAVLTDACAPRALDIGPLADADWQNAARRAPTARRIGRRLWLTPADHSGPAPAATTHVRLGMGLAFGTGEHPTTALCLEWLEQRIDPGVSVLDYGCGSGVLAIVALALGASRAWAVDDDPQALQATAQNAELNGVRERLWIGLPEALPALEADIVVANILAGPLQMLAPTLSRRLTAGGALVLSGVLAEQRDRVQQAYSPYCVDFSSVERGGWMRIDAYRAPR